MEIRKESDDMRQHLLVTGRKRSGKSTFITSLLDRRFIGVKSYAHVTGEDGLAVVYMEHGETGERHIIADRATGKMRPYVDVLDDFGVRCLEYILDSEHEFVYIDEIGFLELSSPRYCQLLCEIFRKKRVIAGVRKDDNPLLAEIFSMGDTLLVDMDARARVGCLVFAMGEPSLIEHTLEGLPLDMLDTVVVIATCDKVVHIAEKFSVGIKRVPSADLSNAIQEGIAEMGDVEGCLVCMCDRPDIEKASLRILVGVFQTNPDTICRITEGSKSIRVIPNTLFSELISETRARGVLSLIGDGIGIIDVQCRSPRELIAMDALEKMEK